MTALLALALLAAAPAPAPGRAWGVVQLGSGTGGWTWGTSATGFGEALARDPLRLFGALEGSGELTGSLQGGIRLSSLQLRAGAAGTRSTLAITRLEAVAAWRPLPAGPYARLGVGPTGLWYDLRVPRLASGRVTAGGAGLSLAAGAFWPIGDRLELRVEAEAAGQAWLPSSRGPDLSWTLGGSAGVAWR